MNKGYVVALTEYILNKKINPRTNTPFTLEDIKNEEYRLYVSKYLKKRSQENEVYKQKTVSRLGV